MGANTLGTNSGFVLTTPEADPDSGQTIEFGRSLGQRHLSLHNGKVIKIGFWNSTEIGRAHV